MSTTPVIYGARAPLPFIKGLVRHLRPVWLMEEIGATYELRFVDLAKEEETSPAFLALNPFGKLPALEDGSLRMFESGAICSYLADKLGKLIPAPKTPERALHDQWMYAVVTMIEPLASRVFAADFFYKDEPEGPVLREAALENFPDNLAAIESQLKKNPYITGRDFAVADIMLTSTLKIVAHTDLMDAHPSLKAYFKRNIARPAHLKAHELQ